MEFTVLKKSTFLITREPLHVVTVLGSCVAVTLYSRKTHDAAICHAVLARPGLNRENDGHVHREGRYVSEVLPRMLDHFLGAGCDPDSIEVKLFGGACIACRVVDRPNSTEVGMENVDEALHLLLDRGLRIKASNTGGVRPHKIYFDTATGEVLHQFIRGDALDGKVRHE